MSKEKSGPPSSVHVRFLNRGGGYGLGSPSALLLLLYSLFSLLLTYPLIVNLTTAVPNDIGDPLLNTWILAWDVNAVLTDPLNLFQANIFYPLPNTLAYSEHLLSTALLALPVQLISREPILAYNLSLLATFPLAAFGLYLLLFRWTGQRSAAFIGGLIFGFAPYRFASVAHLQLLSFQWLPFALLFLDKLMIPAQRLSPAADQLPTAEPFRRVRYHIVLAIFLLLQILASWYLAVYTAVIIAIYLTVALVARRLTLPVFIRIAVTLVSTLLLSLPFAWPYIALIDDLREARPLSLALSLSSAPADFAAAPPFNLLFGPLTESLRLRSGFTEENTLFVGIIAPMLALVWLWLWLAAHILPERGGPSGLSAGQLQLKPLASIFLTIVLGVAVLLTFPIPYSVLASVIPFSTVIRVPPRWMMLGLFALASLAAFGYAAINQKLSTNRMPRQDRSNSALRTVFGGKPGIFLVLCTLLLVSEALSIPLPLAEVENRTALNPAYRWLSRQPQDFTLIELPLHSAPDPEFPEVKRLYASTVGWWPIFNGYSGYTPPRQPELARAVANFPYERAIPTLQTLVSVPESSGSAAQPAPPLYLLIHPGEAPLNRTQWETVDRWRAERDPALRPLGQFEGDYLYQVFPPDPSRFSAPPLGTFGWDQAMQLVTITVEHFSATDGVPMTSHPSQAIILWQNTAPLIVDYTVFIHLRAADGFVHNQADGPPVSGHYPTTAWQPYEIVQDIHDLPKQDFSQIDHLAVGLYNPLTNERLPAFGPDGKRLADDALIVPLP